MYGEDSSGRRVSLLNGPSPITPKAAFTKLPTSRRPPPPPPPPPVSSNPLRSLPPLNPLRRPQSFRPQKRLSQSPETPRSRTPPLIRHNSNSPRSESTTSPMTPEYFQDPLDSHLKSSVTSTPSGYHAQMYQTMVAQRNAYSPQSYHIPPFDLGTGEANNGFGALNQQALQNLQPPLKYPNRQPQMTTINTSVADLHSATFAPAVSDSPTSASSSSRHRHHQQETQEDEKPVSHSAGTQTSTTSTGSPTTSAVTPAKKKFPCPHAVRFDCPDTFTTSGHASRHGKKHTGEKSVICPTCSKAFTRKDNMKQHERTHKNGGNPANHGQGSAGSATTTSPSMSSTTQSDLASKKDSKDGAGKAQTNGHGKHEEDGEGESPGLDALAMAAGIE
ncbi:MAG: hypothetical protein LQ345_002447 [Seirophora villosa]|nr:MAG: hypothetical protein LQ345_002447 [Seirophora villosa]